MEYFDSARLITVAAFGIFFFLAIDSLYKMNKALKGKPGKEAELFPWEVHCQHLLLYGATAFVLASMVGDPIFAMMIVLYLAYMAIFHTDLVRKWRPA